MGCSKLSDKKTRLRRLRLVGSGDLADLISNPERIASEIERERAARRGAPGWLGVTPRYNAQAVLAFGDGVTEVEVHPRSPAYRNRLRTGDVVTALSVTGEKVPFENFYALNMPAGTEVGVEFVRPRTSGAIAMATTVKLVAWPRTRLWELRPRIAPGARVGQKERPTFLAEMLPYLRDALSAPRDRARGERRTGWFAAYAVLSFQVLVRDNDRKAGVWGRQRDTARHLGLSTKTVNEIVQQLCWVGVLKRLSFPTRERDSNLYEVTWPMRDQSAPQPPPVPLPPARRVRRVKL
jgi:hypothetical protein